MLLSVLVLLLLLEELESVSKSEELEELLEEGEEEEVDVLSSLSLSSEEEDEESSLSDDDSLAELMLLLLVLELVTLLDLHKNFRRINACYSRLLYRWLVGVYLTRFQLCFPWIIVRWQKRKRLACGHEKKGYAGDH